MVAYLDNFKHPNGLFLITSGCEFFRGRGDGWVAADAEMLRSLAENLRTGR